MSFSVRDHNKQKSPQMFDRIAPTYDLVNRLLSFRLDISWRRKVGSLLPIKDRLQLLDLATGTGDLVIDLCNSFPDRIATAFGVDLSENMLQKPICSFTVIHVRQQSWCIVAREWAS